MELFDYCFVILDVLDSCKQFLVLSLTVLIKGYIDSKVSLLNLCLCVRQFQGLLIKVISIERYFTLVIRIKSTTLHLTCESQKSTTLHYSFGGSTWDIFERKSLRLFVLSEY